MRVTPTITTVVQNVNLFTHTLTVHEVSNVLYTAVSNAAGASDALVRYTLDAEI